MIVKLFSVFFLLISCMLSHNSTAQTNIELIPAWETDTLVRTPESALYDSEMDLIFVTNMNTIHDDGKDGDGFISLISPDGKIKNLHWIDGLNDPKGMAIFKGKLYVGDLTQLVEIDIAQNKIVKRYEAEGSLMLNDVAILPNGEVYVTDTRKNKLFVLKEGKLQLAYESAELNRPNGLFTENGKLLITSMGSGLVTKFDPVRLQNSPWISGIPSADGIARYKEDGYFISNWNGEIYFVNTKSQAMKVLDTKSPKINAADINYSSKYNLLFVPTFFTNKVMAYKIKAN